MLIRVCVCNITGAAHSRSMTGALTAPALTPAAHGAHAVFALVLGGTWELAPLTRIRRGLLP